MSTAVTGPERQARRWSDELEHLSGGLVRVDGASLLHERMALTGAVPQGTVSAGGACHLMRAADGWIAASLPRTSDYELVPALTEAGAGGSWLALHEWAASRRAVDIAERARLLGMAISRLGESQPALALPPPAAWPVPFGNPLVVDFSALWAGPLCARLLGLAGARVIKVESRDRPDGARRGNAAFYERLHAGHEEVVVEPGTADGGARLRELVESADIVIEASRPRALAGWGLDADEAVAAGTIWVSITAYGRAQGDRIGFGDDVAAGAGLVEWDAGSTPPQPSFVGDAIADPLTGLAAAVAVVRLVTSGARKRRLLDVSMASAAACAIAAGNIQS